jgi:hypothetical protein
MASDCTRVEADGLGDWRMQAATRLASDLPPAYSGGPAHKAGTAVYLTTVASTPEHPNFSFLTPSAAALTLDAAFRSAAAAADLWPQIRFQTVVTPDGPGTSIATSDVPLLFDFLTNSIAAAGSSFQAIEAFANETIARNLTGMMTMQRRKGPEELDAEDVERRVSTEEKIATVVPHLLKIAPIKGTANWENFVRLKSVRDAATHFKSGDQYSLAGKIGKDSLYFILLNHDSRQFPLTALRLMWALRQSTATPRWLVHLAEKYGVA